METIGSFRIKNGFNTRLKRNKAVHSGDRVAGETVLPATLITCSCRRRRRRSSAIFSGIKGLKDLEASHLTNQSLNIEDQLSCIFNDRIDIVLLGEFIEEPDDLTKVHVVLQNDVPVLLNER